MIVNHSTEPFVSRRVQPINILSFLFSRKDIYFFNNNKRFKGRDIIRDHGGSNQLKHIEHSVCKPFEKDEMDYSESCFETVRESFCSESLKCL